MILYVTNDTETLRYAAEELSHYLKKMDDIACDIQVGHGDDGILLGLIPELGLSTEGISDAMIDDVIDVRVEHLHGYIAGSNERSVLMGVYRYLKSAGCRWVRPGERGEYVPQKDMRSHSFRFRKKADYPFRGECIEGAVSFEHVRDTILWLPKVDMNLFMMEQIVPYNYMSRWYKHTVNTKIAADEPPYEQYCAYALELEHIVKKCGLQLHALGHGALNEPFGLRHMISGQHYDVPEEIKPAFAMINGKRELHLNSPFFTELCLSQEWIQDKVVNWLADYLDQKPYIDFLHFWLADYINNHCECEECVKHTPSDLYVQMLNKLDAKLTERGNPAKIVFIMYTDTLWPPIREKLNHPERFIMTTALTRRSLGYNPYQDAQHPDGIPEWKRNNYGFSDGLEVRLAFLNGWKKIFDGPKFTFDYYLYTDHFADPGYMTFSRKIIDGIRSLEATGFGGIMDDQTQRSFFPTGLPNTVLGEFQFDKALDTESFIDDYFQASFGDDWKLAENYLETLSDLFDMEALSQNTSIVAQDTGAADETSKRAGIIGNEAIGNRIATVPSVVDAFADTVAAHCTLADPCHAESWRILTYHGEYCKRLAPIYVALSKNDTELANRLLNEMIDYLSEAEPEIHPYFDLVLFNQRTKQLIAGK